MKNYFLIVYLIFMITSCGAPGGHNHDHGHDHEHGHDHDHAHAEVKTTVHYEQEKNFSTVKQLTFGGDNAEAYFSFDDEMIVFQSNNPAWSLDCDQIFYTRLDEAKMDKEIPTLISTGLGRTTCSYFMPGDSTILFASTHMGNGSCPHVPEPREDGKYVWPRHGEIRVC